MPEGWELGVFENLVDAWKRRKMGGNGESLLSVDVMDSLLIST